MNGLAGEGEKGRQHCLHKEGILGVQGELTACRELAWNWGCVTRSWLTPCWGCRVGPFRLGHWAK